VVQISFVSALYRVKNMFDIHRIELTILIIAALAAVGLAAIGFITLPK
jgi:hypothetical protein